MFSGKVDEQAQALATSSGAQGFVGKPFDLQHLIDQTKQIVPSDRSTCWAGAILGGAVGLASLQLFCGAEQAGDDQRRRPRRG